MQPFPTSAHAGTSGTFSSTESLPLQTGGSEHKEVASIAAMTVSDIFQPIATESPPSQVPSRGDHPVPRLGIVSRAFRITRSFGLRYVGIGLSDLPDLDEQVLREFVPWLTRSRNMDPPVFINVVQGNWKCPKLGNVYLPRGRRSTSVRATANGHTWISRAILY